MGEGIIRCFDTSKKDISELDIKEYVGDMTYVSKFISNRREEWEEKNLEKTIEVFEKTIILKQCYQP